MTIDEPFSLHVTRLARQAETTRFKGLAEKICELDSEKQLKGLAIEAPRKDRNVKGYLIELGPDKFVVHKGPVNHPLLTMQLPNGKHILPPKVAASLVNVHPWTLHLTLYRRRSKPVLMACEYGCYYQRKRADGKLGRRFTRDGDAFPTSIRLPPDLHDRIREEQESLNDIVVTALRYWFKRKR